MFSSSVNTISKNLTSYFELKLPVNKFYIKSELIWLDSFLFDYLQKKTTDLWIRRFIILSGFLFSEHYIYNFVIRIYTLNFTNVISTKIPFENFNPIENILNIFFFITILILLSFFFTIFLLI